MDVQLIEREIERLKAEGETSYENCEKLVLLEKARRCLSGPVDTASRKEDHPEGPVTMMDAEAWVSRMKNADGTTGAHWPPDKTEQIRAQHKIDCDPVEFWAAMNMMYSDYCEAAKKNSVNTVDFYTDMAKAFLSDPDARPNKLTRYYECVAER